MSTSQGRARRESRENKKSRPGVAAKLSHRSSRASVQYFPLWSVLVLALFLRVAIPLFAVEIGVLGYVYPRIRNR